MIQTIFGANINCLILRLIFLPSEVNKTATSTNFTWIPLFLPDTCPFMVAEELFVFHMFLSKLLARPLLSYFFFSSWHVISPHFLWVLAHSNCFIIETAEDIFLCKSLHYLLLYLTFTCAATTDLRSGLNICIFCSSASKITTLDRAEEQK